MTEPKEKTIIKRLAAVRDDFAGGLEKSAASKLGYQYHSIEALMDRVRPLFVKHGVLMTVSLGHSYTPQPAGRIAATVTATFYSVDGAPDDWVMESCFVDASNSGRSDGKGAGIAMSYGVKNILLKMLNVGSGDEDPEAYDADPKLTKKKIDTIASLAKEKLGKSAKRTVSVHVKENFGKGFGDLNSDEYDSIIEWLKDLEQIKEESKD